MSVPPVRHYTQPNHGFIPPFFSASFCVSSSFRHLAASSPHVREDRQTLAHGLFGLNVLLFPDQVAAAHVKDNADVSDVAGRRPPLALILYHPSASMSLMISRTFIIQAFTPCSAT
jgi:hypothetical protein